MATDTFSWLLDLCLLCHIVILCLFNRFLSSFGHQSIADISAKRPLFIDSYFVVAEAGQTIASSVSLCSAQVVADTAEALENFLSALMTNQRDKVFRFLRYFIYRNKSTM